MQRAALIIIFTICLICIPLVFFWGEITHNTPISVPTQTRGADSTDVPARPSQLLNASFQSETGQSYQVEIVNPTFLSNERRNYYGNQLPNSLELVWKHHLGTGETRVNGLVKWSGAGWTGQPLMVIENGQKFIIQGAYDHHLKKINAETGKLVWQYKFEDVLKGTGSIWLNPNADSLEHKCIIMQGSRSGAGGLSAPRIESYRAVSYFTGKELWRINSAKTRCYSRDVDGSCLMFHDTAYIGLENGIFTVFNPDRKAAKPNQQGIYEPFIYKNTDTLYRAKDALVHGGNLVTEASPCRLGNRIYVASGSGRIWGYNLHTQVIDWEYFIGSDIDGSPVVTDDSCLLISVEKQYIKGKGGLLKLNPRKAPEQALVWYFPTENRNFASWQGGIIGTACTNEAYKQAGEPSLAAFIAIDGNLYVVNVNDTMPNTKVLSFDGVTLVPTPQLVYKYPMGASISTPLMVGNRLIALGYEGLYLFEFDKQLNFKVLDKVSIRGEATPFVDNERVYVASRDGHLYCFGNKTLMAKGK